MGLNIIDSSTWRRDSIGAGWREHVRVPERELVWGSGRPGGLVCTPGALGNGYLSSTHPFLTRWGWGSLCVRCGLRGKGGWGHGIECCCC